MLICCRLIHHKVVSLTVGTYGVSKIRCKGTTKIWNIQVFYEKFQIYLRILRKMTCYSHRRATVPSEDSLFCTNKIRACRSTFQKFFIYASVLANNFFLSFRTIISPQMPQNDPQNTTPPRKAGLMVRIFIQPIIT